VTSSDRGGAGAGHELSDLVSAPAAAVTTATLVVNTRGQEFTEITQDADRFLAAAAAKDGVLLLFLRHTSASLVIQENAAPEVRVDLASALDRLAPEGPHWRHADEGPDDMPSHVKAMLTGVSLHVPVRGGAMLVGRWQGVFLAEHRTARHRREVVLQFVGTNR
jgi:secondary thiamine-phosphate synthase enzyme